MAGRGPLDREPDGRRPAIDPRRLGWIQAVLVVATIFLTWGALLLGQRPVEMELAPGQPSPQTFVAPARVEVEDPVATEAAREAAASRVEDVYTPDPAVRDQVIGQISAFFSEVANAVFVQDEVATTTTTTTLPEPDASSTTTVPSSSTTVAGEGGTEGGTGSTGEEATTTTEPVRVATVSGQVFLDVDADGRFDGDGDLGVPDIAVEIVDGAGRTVRVVTDRDGFFSTSGIEAGTIVVDVLERRLGSRYELAAGEDPVTVEVAAEEEVTIPPIGFRPKLRGEETVIAELSARYPNLQPETVATLVRLAREDAFRRPAGLSSYLDAVRDAALQRADQILRSGIRDTAERQAAVQALADSPPLVLLDQEVAVDAGRAAGDVVGIFLVPNLRLDVAETERLRQAARDAVTPIMRVYEPNEVIVRQGERLQPVHIAAIEELGLLERRGPHVWGLFAMVSVLVILLAFYLARFRPNFWATPRRLGLFGVLIVLTALAARSTALLESVVPPDVVPLLGYAIPAAAFGLMAAVLFDARIGVLLTIAVGVLVALATGELAPSVFAMLSALVPIPFVSAISTRRDYRQAVLYTSVALGVIALPVAWFFDGTDIVGRAAAVAVANGLFSGFVGMAALSFLEAVFDITTALRLLDLTDRNHPALQLLQEEAWGTFNHALMVGTLADKAARAIGANSLLARAAAYYHDLGKTENPTFFIENQFGMSNPHDRLPPEESVAIIRQHVIDGMALARRFRIPEEVAAGIEMHHGTGVMRYFYEKAKERYGAENVNIDDYRHTGRKPTSREMAILMLADAIEGATRAVFSKEDPSPEKIRQVVEKVVAEKVKDGQLDESDLTLGELKRVKDAFVDALVAHFHQRIEYPNFPDLTETDGEEETGTEGDGSRPVATSEDGRRGGRPSTTVDITGTPSADPRHRGGGPS